MASFLIPAAVAGIGSAYSAYQQGKAADAQTAAAAKAQADQLAAIQAATNRASRDITGGAPAGLESLIRGGAMTEDRLGQLAGMQSQLGVDRLGQFDQGLAGMLGTDLLSPEQLQANFQTDPGYQFRQQQGEEAINRAAAARGGRLSGRTLEDLMGFNQNLASQEFGNFANREAQRQSSNRAAQQFGAASNLGLAQFGLGGQFGTMGQLAGMPLQMGQMGQGIQANLGSQLGGAQLGTIAPTQSALTTSLPYAGLGNAANANAINQTMQTLTPFLIAATSGGSGGGKL